MSLILFLYFKIHFREFPGGPVAGTPRFHCCGLGSIPGQGTKIPQATWRGQKKKGEEETFILVFIAKEPGARNMPSADPWWGGDGGDDNDS